MTVDITGVRPNMRPYGNDFADGTLNPPVELRAPPLAPNETTAAGHVLLRVDTIRPVIGGEDPFQPSEPSNPSETFRARRTMIAGTAIIATLGLAGLTFFFFASPGAKVPAESAPIAVQSSTEAPVEAAANVPEPSSPTSVESSSETAAVAPPWPEPSRGALVPSPDNPPSIAGGASRQVAPGAETPQIASGAQNGDPVFLQRPGVNIRSAPSGNAPVLGTAPRGTQFTASSRDGDWIQVENAQLKGWINSQFLGPKKPL